MNEPLYQVGETVQMLNLGYVIDAIERYDVNLRMGRYTLLGENGVRYHNMPGYLLRKMVVQR
jgi:hypothetical protein